MKLLIIFVVLNVLNVIIQTVKSICTIKCGKVSAALINAVAFGLYTIVLVYMNCDLNLFTKAGIVALCNLIGVYVVKLIEEKMRKDNAKFISVQGREGVGKTVICKKFIEDENMVLYARAERFLEETHLEKIWNLDIRRILECLNGKKIIFFIRLGGKYKKIRK